MCHGARCSGGKPADPPVWARCLVNQTVMRLGGQRSIAASCVWYVIGLEVPVSRWSLERGGVDRHVATGVLLAALGILEHDFAGPARSAA